MSYYAQGLFPQGTSQYLNSNDIAVEILRFLYENPDDEYYMKEFQDRFGIKQVEARAYLHNLYERKLINKRLDDKRIVRLWSFNKNQINSVGEYLSRHPRKEVVIK